MQDHSTVIPSSPLSFTQKESHIKRNMGFVKELDSRMKNDINAGRRKLFNSLSTGQMRDMPLPNLTHQNQAFFRENFNNRPLQHEKSNPDLVNHQQRQVFSQVPEEADVLINKLINQLNETKRQRDVLRNQTISKPQIDVEALNKANMTIAQLKQVITQNDFNARQAISKIHQQKEQLRLKNQQMAVTLQNSFKARNDKAESQVLMTKPCNRCDELDEKLRRIEAELRAINSKYQKEVQKNETLRSQNSVFLNELQQKYRDYQQKMRESSQQIVVLRQEKRQLQKVIFKLRNSPTVQNEQYQNLRIQYENLRQTNKILQNQFENLSFHNSQGISHLNSVTQKIHEILLENEVEYQEDQPIEVERMLSDLQFKCSQYKVWLEERERRDDNSKQLLQGNYRRLQMDFNLFRERALQDEQKYKNIIEQLNRELIQKSHQNTQKSNLHINQEYINKINQLTHLNQVLKRQVTQKELTIKDSKQKLYNNEQINFQKDLIIQEMKQHLESTQQSLRNLQQTEQLLKQKDILITQIENKLVQAQQILVQKDTAILQKQTRLEQTESFMQTVLSQQMEQLSNSLNLVLAENQSLKNQNYQLKGHIQMNPILEQANKKLLGEIKFINEQYQSVASRNRGLQEELMTLTAQNNKNLQSKRLIQLELQDLRKEIENSQPSDSPSKVRYNEEISNLQRQLTETWEQQKRMQERNNQRYTEDIILLQRRYEQKINNLQFELKQRHQSEIELMRHQLETQFKKKIAEKELSIASLTSSSQKYGEVLIKYNTLNIDYQTLVVQSKQREEHLQKQLNELQFILESVRNQAQDKIREIEEVNRQLNVQNTQTYKNLQNAENYIYELLQKLKYFEQSTTQKVDSNQQINLLAQQARIELINEFNKEKQHLVARYQTQLSSRQSHIQKYEIQINQQRTQLTHRQNIINNLTKELQELNQKSKKLQMNYNMQTEQLTRQLNYRLVDLNQRQNIINRLSIDLKEFQEKSKDFQLNVSKQTQTLTQQLNQQTIQLNHKQNLINGLIKDLKDLDQKSKVAQLNYSRQTETLNKQIQTLTQQLNLSFAQVAQKNKEVQTLRNSFSDRDRILSETTAVQTKLKELQQRLQVTNTQIIRKDQEIRQFTTYIEQLRSQNVRLQGELQSKISEILLLKSNNEEELQSSSKKSSRVKARSEYKQGLNRVEHELQQSRKQLNGAENHIRQLEQTIIYAQQQIKKLNSYIVDLQKKSQTSQNEESPLKRVQYETEIENLKIQLNNLSIVNTQKQDQIVWIKSQIQKLKAIKHQYQRIANQKEVQLNKDVQFFKNKLDEAESYIFYMEKKLQEEKQTIMQPDDMKLNQIKAENQQLIKQLRELEIIVNEKEGAYISIQNEVNELRKLISVVEKQRDNVKMTHNKQLVVWQNLVHTLKQQKQKIRQQNSQVVKQHKLVIQKTASLQMHIRQNQQNWNIILNKKTQEKEYLERKLQETNIKTNQLQNKIRQQQNVLESKQRELQILKGIITQFQSKVQDLNKKLLRKQQNTNNQLINGLQIKLNEQEKIILQIQKELQEAKFKLAEKQLQFLKVEEKIGQNQALIKQNLQQLQTKAEELQFFKNKLGQAEEYIYRLQNQQQTQKVSVLEDNQKTAALERQIIELTAQLQKNRSELIASEIRKQMQKKFNESQSSAEAIQSNLSKAVNQAETYTIEIIRLKQEKQKIEDVVSQIKNELANTQVELQFFKNKLSEAEDYILYLESKRGEDDNKISINVSSEQIQRLNNQIKDLINKNRDLENEKNKLSTSLSTLSEELRRVTDSLENNQRQLKQALATVQFLQESKRRSDQKISELKVLLEKISDEANFFKDKLRQAQNYINYFEEQKLRQQTKIQPIEVRDKSSQLVATILNLEGVIRNLELEKDALVIQLEDKNKQIKSVQKQIDSLKREREGLIQRVTYSQSLLMGNIEKIQVLQKQLRQAEFKPTEKTNHPTSLNSEYQMLIFKLKERVSQLEDQLQLSYKTIDELKKSVNQNERHPKTQQKISIHSNFTQIPRENQSEQFFKNKLLQAQSYIQQLEKQKESIEKALLLSEAKANKSQSDIHNLNKELLLSASDKKVLQSNILQLNKLNENLKDSLKIAASNNNSTVAIQLSEENTQLKATLLEVQAASKRQLQDMISKYNELKSANDEEKQKLRVSEQAKVKLILQIGQNHILLQNYSKKAKEAEKEIANKQDNQELLATLGSLGNLKENAQKLQSRNVELQKRLADNEIKLNTADKTIVVLNGQVDLLKNKLLSSQRFIIELQKQLREKQAQNYDEDRVRQQIQKIGELQQKNKEIQMRLILSEQKEKRYIQTIQTQQLNLNFFKDSLSSAEQQIEVVKRNIDFAQKKTKEDAEIIKVLQTEINRYGKAPEQEAAFFKTKLLEAESYITTLTKENKDLKQKADEPRYENLVKEIESLNEQIDHLHQELVMSESLKKEAEHGYEEMCEKLSQITLNNKNRADQVQKLNQQIEKMKNLLIIQNRKYNDDIQQLRKQLIQSYNKINQLQRENEKMEQQKDEIQEKIQSLQAEVKSDNQDKEQQYNSQFFKEKLFEAQGFIKQLQEQNNVLKIEISGFNTQIQILKQQISKLKEKQALSLQQSLQRSKVESKHIQQMKEAAQQITLVNSQNQELKQKIEAFGEANAQIIKRDETFEIKFLKEKLFEAESYIVELEKEIESLTTENVDKEATIKQMQDNIMTLNEHVVEAESKAHQLQIIIETNKQQITQLNQISSSTEKHEIILKAKEQQILELNIKLQMKERQTQQKQTQTEQIKVTLNRQIDQIKKKLLQAQSYIIELERENDKINSNVEQLNEQMRKLQIQISGMVQKINNSDTQNLVLNGQLKNLKEQNQELRTQIQKGNKLLLVGSEQQKQKISVILREKQELQSSFSQQKLKINVELGLVRNQLQGKIRQLQQALQINQQLSARNTQLQVRNTQLQQEVKVQYKSIENISNSMVLKQQKLASIQPLIQKLQNTQNLITELQQQKNTQYNKTTQLLDQINRITDQNNTLHQRLEDLQRNEQEEAALTYQELQRLKLDFEKIKNDNTTLQNQLNILTHQLSQKANEVNHQNQLITLQKTQRKNLKQIIGQLQKENQQLRSNIASLESVQKQFADFKAVVEQKEAADRELAEIEKQIQEQNLNRSKEKSQSSQFKDSSKNKELELSLQQAKKELENELREESNAVTKELERQIDNLKKIVSQKQEETRYLQEEKIKQEEAIKQLEEYNQELIVEKQSFETRQKHMEQIQHALVEAESEKLLMQEETQKLRNEISRAHNTAEEYKKENLKLENDVINLTNEIKTHVAQIENTKENIKNKEKMNEDLQNNLRNIILEYQGRIQEYNNNIRLLNNRLGESQAKAEELESKIKSIIIEEQPTEINVKQREQENNQSDSENQENQKLQSQLEQMRQQLEQVSQHLVMAESQLGIMKINYEQREQEVRELKSKIQEKQMVINTQNDKIDILMAEQLKEKEEILKEKELIEEDLTLAEKKMSQKELQFEGKEQKIGSSIRKLIDITNNYHQDEAGDPTEVLEQLQSFPYLNELITSILYRLRLSSAIELQKSLKIQSLKNQLEIYKSQAQNVNETTQLKKTIQSLRQQNQQLKTNIFQITHEKQRLSTNQPQEKHPNQGIGRQPSLLETIAQLHNENNELKNQLEQLKQVGLGGQRYEELLRQCADYEIHNGELEERLKQITHDHQKQKEKIKQYEEQIEVLLSSSQSRDLYQENLELRQKLTESQKMISSIKEQDSSGSVNTQQQFKLEFLHLCLNKVDQIENQVRKVESEIQHLSHREIRYNLPSSSEYKPEDSHLMERLQELQEQLIKNAENIREHHQKSDAELYILLKDLINDEQIPAKSKEKIQDYLAQLQQQIVRQYEQHQNEVAILKEQIMRNNRDRQGQFSDRSRQNLIREIENLNNAIEIYHQQTMRRKRVYKRVLQGLLLDMQHLKQKYQAEEYEEITKKIQEAIQRNDQQDLEFDGEDFIITGGSANVEMLEQDLEEKQPQEPKNKDSLAMQTEEDKKPFLKFLLSAQDIDKQDLKLLKRKIAELRGRQVEQNLQILKNKEKKLEQVLQLTNKETSAQQIQNIMVTLANNYSRDEISQIFGSEDNDELINKLNEALCLEESFYRGLNSSVMMQEIEERKRKYYETPTKLSEEVFKHLLGLLSAKKDEEFYQQVDSLFRSMYQIQDGFEVSLRKKDQIYRSHNERMNQIFNRSSSDNSEDYLAEFQRGNMEEVQLHVRSERKPYRSSQGSELEQSPQRE